MKAMLLAAAAALGLAAASLALAQAKPEVLVKQREAAMTLMGKYFGPLVAMARGKAPYNHEVAARNAAYLHVLDKMPWDGFAPSTRGAKSLAKPAVFEKPQEFKQHQERLEDAVAKLASATKGGDETAVKAAIGSVGKACGSCHDDFREKQ